MVSPGLDLCGSEYVQVAGSCKHSNKPAVSAKCDEFFGLVEKQSASEKGLCFMDLFS